MNRRQILKYSAMLTGTALCAPLTTAMLVGCSKPADIAKLSAESVSKTLYFNAEDFSLLAQVMDAILPKTDTPSATEVGTDQVMDQLFAQVFEAEYKTKFMANFVALQAYLDTTGFTTLPSSQQAEVLQALELNPSKDAAYWAYIDIKQQTLAYFLSSEQIAEQHLNYLPIPGEFKPCVAVADLGGKAWAI
jgi:hypothetical protein